MQKKHKKSGLRKWTDKWRFRFINNNPAVCYSKIFLVPRVLKMKPIPVEKDSFREIHVLVSRKDFMGMLWSLRSFYRNTDARFPLTVHDDGSLLSWHAKTVNGMFPNSRLILRSQSDREVSKYLEQFPECRKFRKFYPLNLKIFDFPYYSKADSILTLDSDAFFFQEPRDLIHEFSGERYNLFHEDMFSNYVFSVEDIKRLFGISVPPRVGTGLGVMRKECFAPAIAEPILAEKTFTDIPFPAEQTVTAILTARLGIRFLKRNYAVAKGRGINGLIAKHYTRMNRHLLYTEAIPYLLRSGRVQ